MNVQIKKTTYTQLLCVVCGSVLSFISIDEFLSNQISIKTGYILSRNILRILMTSLLSCSATGATCSATGSTWNTAFRLSTAAHFVRRHHRVLLHLQLLLVNGLLFFQLHYRFLLPLHLLMPFFLQDLLQLQQQYNW